MILFTHVLCVKFCLDDHSRVVLDKIEGAVDSDYINASYIDVSFYSICNNVVPQIHIQLLFLASFV